MTEPLEPLSERLRIDTSAACLAADHELRVGEDEDGQPSAWCGCCSLVAATAIRDGFPVPLVAGLVAGFRTWTPPEPEPVQGQP